MEISMNEFRIDKLLFSSGQKIELEANSVTIFIGANSSGKSSALREIFQKLQGADNIYRVIQEITTFTTGDEDEWQNWLQSNFLSSVVNGEVRYKTLGSEISPNRFTSSILNKNFPPLVNFLVRLLDTETRLSLTRPVTRIDLLAGGLQHAFHIIQQDDKKLEIISKVLQSTFGKEFMLDHGNQEIGAYVGKEPERTRERDRISKEYIIALRKETRLEMDGDGIRSFVACLLATQCTPNKVFLIDEPEVFLHPPQARRLGQIMAEIALEEKRQIIIATHSTDIIKGALSIQEGKVSICRIDLVNNQNNVYSLNNKELRDLWSKPLLKSTDAIQGAFHKGVVVCEADADCRFYEGILISLDKEAIDLHFVHGGGKGELATLAHSYKRLHVPTAVIADFDILRNKKELEKLVKSLGGDFHPLESIYKEAMSNLNSLAPSQDRTSVSKTLHELADKIKSGEKKISSETIEEISEWLQDGREWSRPKKHGIDAFNGGANLACQQLLDTLAKIGLFVVPIGEMEGWARSLPSNKNEWIKEALNKIDSDPKSFENTRDFVRRVVQYLSSGISETD